MGIDTGKMVRESLERRIGQLEGEKASLHALATDYKMQLDDANREIEQAKNKKK